MSLIKDIEKLIHVASKQRDDRCEDLRKRFNNYWDGYIDSHCEVIDKLVKIVAKHTKEFKKSSYKVDS